MFARKYQRVSIDYQHEVYEGKLIGIQQADSAGKRALKSDNFSLWKRHQIYKKRDLSFQTHIRLRKWKLWNILCLRASNLASTSLRHLARSSLSVRQDWIKVLLFWTKYVVPHQIKPRILMLTMRKDESNIRIAFICVNLAQQYYYRVVSVGQAGFHCRLYRGRSCRILTSY